MKRILSLGFVALLLAIAALIMPSASGGTAHAATFTDTTHCASLGTLIEVETIKDGSTLLGYLNVYYNSANGYNCAETTSSNVTYGVKKEMIVDLFACQETVSGNTCTVTSSDYDDNNYYYYAGPAGVHGAGHCIAAIGEIEWGGTYYGTTTSPFADHCG